MRIGKRSLQGKSDSRQLGLIAREDRDGLAGIVSLYPSVLASSVGTRAAGGQSSSGIALTPGTAQAAEPARHGVPGYTRGIAPS